GMDDRFPLFPLIVGIELDIVAHTVGAEKPKYRVGLEQPPVHNPLQQGVGIAEEAPGRGSDGGVFQDGRIVTGQLPGLKERSPVDEWHYLLQRIVPQRSHPKKTGLGRRGAPVYDQPIPASVGQWLFPLLGLAISALDPDLLILRLYSGNVVGPHLIAA